MIWVINGMHFKHNFLRTAKKPNNWDEEYSNHLYLNLKPRFFRPQLTVAGHKNKRNASILYDCYFSGNSVSENKWIYYWNYESKTWPHCRMPVFIDFGKDELWWLSKNRIVQKVSKSQFVNKYRCGAE